LRLTKKNKKVLLFAEIQRLAQIKHLKKQKTHSKIFHKMLAFMKKVSIEVYVIV